MTTPSPILRICLGLGITASSVLAGFLYTTSSTTIPAILATHDPSTLITQWHAIFQSGIKIGPSLALLGAVNYLYVAWDAYNNSAGENGRGLWRLFVGAAVGTGGIIPYTLIVMGATNNQLLEQSAKLTMGEADVRVLVEKWGFLNLIRSGIPVLGTALGLYGAL